MADKDQEQGWHALGGGAHGSGNQLGSMQFCGPELEPIETALRGSFRETDLSVSRGSISNPDCFGELRSPILGGIRTQVGWLFAKGPLEGICLTGRGCPVQASAWLLH